MHVVFVSLTRRPLPIDCRFLILLLDGLVKIILCKFLMLIPVEKTPEDAIIIASVSVSTNVRTESLCSPFVPQKTKNTFRFADTADLIKS